MLQKGRQHILEELIEKICKRLNDGAYPNEAAVSFSILMPILRALGWDDSDPDQVIPEHSSGGRRVDFALCGTSKRPSVFVEVKGVGRALEGDRQLFEYAFHEGIPICVLTDGRDWSFYLPSGQGSYDDRRVYRLQLNERPAIESARIFERYLSRARVKSGEALDAANQDYRDIASKREASRNLPQAWQQLISGPEDLLIDLLVEQTEGICGFRPSVSEVTEFFRGLSPATGSNVRDTSKAPVSSIVKSPPKQVSAPNHALPGRRAASSRSIEYEVFGQKRKSPDASGAFIDAITEIAKRYPQRIGDFAEAAKGRSRNHIARTVEEIYPKRPDLARAIEFSPGWLVGLNIANREKKRILFAVCDVAQLRFGKDIVIDFPNADL
jgi:predicted type IV restriction endonuclease